MKSLDNAETIKIATLHACRTPYSVHSSQPAWINRSPLFSYIFPLFLQGGFWGFLICVIYSVSFYHHLRWSDVLLASLQISWFSTSFLLTSSRHFWIWCFIFLISRRYFWRFLWLWITLFVTKKALSSFHLASLFDNIGVASHAPNPNSRHDLSLSEECVQKSRCTISLLIIPCDLRLHNFYSGYKNYMVSNHHSI